MRAASAPRQRKSAHDMATPVRCSALLIVLSIALSSSAVACEPKPLSDTDESFALAAAKRMTRLGVTDVEPAAPLKDGGELYVLLGSKVRLAIRDDGGYPTEVGTFCPSRRIQMIAIGKSRSSRSCSPGSGAAQKPKLRRC
jgi:hypothetical protein